MTLGLLGIPGLMVRNEVFGYFFMYICRYSNQDYYDELLCSCDVIVDLVATSTCWLIFVLIPRMEMCDLQSVKLQGTIEAT